MFRTILLALFFIVALHFFGSETTHGSDYKPKFIPFMEVYVVQRGDTLKGIAAKYRGVHYTDIAIVNKIDPPYKIIPGWRIFVPVPREPPPSRRTIDRNVYARLS